MVFCYQINGKRILWQQLRGLYDAKLSLLKRSKGLFLLKKLSKEHLDLTSYSRMRVDLAAEVSNTILVCCAGVATNSFIKPPHAGPE